jgi:lipid-binding SYLF domain-containing protein
MLVKLSFLMNKAQWSQYYYRKRRNCKMKMRRILFKALGFMITFTVVFGLLATVSYAKTKSEINASVEAALNRFKKEVKGANEYLKVAKGVLVMPNVTKAGFIIGGQYGQGALEVGGKTVDYYSLAAGSLGWQIGAEKYDMIIIFATDAALKKFQSGEGWEAGADAEVTMISAGVDAPVSTLVSQHPVLCFITDQKGLMAGVSVKGAKFNRIKPD